MTPRLMPIGITDKIAINNAQRPMRDVTRQIVVHRFGSKRIGLRAKDVHRFFRTHPHGLKAINREKGKGYVPYHFTVHQDGRVVQWLPMGAIGAHAGRRANADGIGVAMVCDPRPGAPEDLAPTFMQWSATAALCAKIREEHGGLVINGHDDVQRPKGCPGHPAIVPWLRMVSTF